MIGAIVQARMTSTRLPGKVLMRINDKPLIEYLFERLSYSSTIKRFILATTTNKEDDILIDFAKKRGIPFFRGSEHDVLDRYMGAARRFDLDYIVRITADCPLIDPMICDLVINTYIKEKPDYAHTGQTFAEGLGCEIFSFEVLSKAHAHAKKKSEREHVTLYINNNPQLFSIITIQNDSDDGKYRFTVDKPEDFEVVKAIIENMYGEDTKPFGLFEIKKFLDSHPEIIKLNQHIIRNEGLIRSLKEDNEQK